MREEEEESDSQAGAELEYRSPDHLVLSSQPGGAAFGEVLDQLPSLYAVDASVSPTTVNARTGAKPRNIPIMSVKGLFS